MKVKDILIQSPTWITSNLEHGENSIIDTISNTSHEPITGEMHSIQAWPISIQSRIYFKLFKVARSFLS